MYSRVVKLLGLPMLTAALLAQQPIDPPIPIDPPGPVIPIPTPIPFPVRGETALVLGINFGIRYVPPSRVTVPVGELLSVSAPTHGPVQWMRNGKPIPGATESTLTFKSVVRSDAGNYWAVYTDAAMAGRGSQVLRLGVGPFHRLLNLSTRGNLGAGAGQNFISGFVVAGDSEPKKMILRAVGPALAGFGVVTPLAQPVLRVFDANGKLYENGYAYAAVDGGPTYESDLADSLARCGAFPIPSGTRDVVVMILFPPGSYTAEVTSGDQTAGSVLLEIYEVP